jgi:hypothetical protein
MTASGPIACISYAFDERGGASTHLASSLKRF